MVGYRPCAGSSYIPLPTDLKGRKCLLNINNTTDNLCFAYTLLADLYSVNNDKTNPDSYKDYLPTLKFDNLHLPIRPRDISKFELLNSLRVNVFGYDSELKTG